METLIAHIANCTIGGEEATRQTSGAWTRDMVRFKAGRWQFEFRQHPDVAKGRIAALRGTFCRTTTVTVPSVRSADLKSVLSMLDDICWLLAFACQSRVMRYAYEYPAGSGRYHQHSVSGCVYRCRPPFELVDGAAVRSFVEQCLPAFSKLKRRRRLPVIFDYLTHVEAPTLPMEMRLLSIFATLECLKDTFARSKKIPYAKGSYRKAATKPGKPGARYTFENLLVMMLRSVGIRRGVKRIVSLRNEIIHSGLSRKSYDQQRRMYENAQDLVREYLLRLLKYSGLYFPYAGRGTRVKRL